MAIKEYQITSDRRNHQLTNINVWTPDSQWIVYDVRPDGASFCAETIEKIHVKTKEIQIIYSSSQGSHVGVVTVSQTEPVRYAFIHGPENPTLEWHYDFHHRRGVIVDDSHLGHCYNIDACSLVKPYQAGALRGGTHVHIFSPDSSRLSFTYNDHVVREYNQTYDLRNVAIAVPLGAVNVHKQHPREYDGHFYSVVISKTTLSPKPNSDEINRAYEEGWIGNHGYLKTNGQRQRWAIAFIGDTLSLSGEKIPEIFIVDLPDELSDYAIEGSQPLAGTKTTLPAPPKGVMQRRITHTENRKYPGLVNQPRFWLRISPAGDKIAFLMKDDNGVVQAWWVSPNGGDLHQITEIDNGITSAFSWDNSGQFLAFVVNNQIIVCDVANKQLHPITEPSDELISGDAVVFSPNNQWIAFTKEIGGIKQICIAQTELV